jgi:glycosyltransferase involved in cell wall biosynthesis/SAM-dependent methyltransferase
VNRDQDGYDYRDERRFYDAADWGHAPKYLREVAGDIVELIPADTVSILDVGCGDGYITNLISEKYFVVGFDLSTVAMRSLRRPGVAGSAFELPFGDGSFDLVMANDVIEHFAPAHRLRVLAELERVSAKSIIVTTPFTERLARGFRGSGSGRTHVNRHHDCFDVASLKSFFHLFSPEIVVFSGDEWDEELLPIEILKRAEISAGRSHYDESVNVALSHQLTDFRSLQAEYFCSDPQVIDYFRRRTELMCLFRKVGCAGPTDCSMEGSAVDYEVALGHAEPRDSLAIRGADFLAYAREGAPLSSLHPYVIGRSDIELSEERALIRSEDGASFLKFGFFAPVEKGATLHIQLDSLDAAKIRVSHYNDAGGYVCVFSQDGLQGSAAIDVQLDEVLASQYGHLFEIVSSHSMQIGSIWIEQGQSSVFLTLAPGARYLRRATAEMTLYTSIQEPLRIVPNWFAHVETMVRRPYDFLENSQAIEEVLLHQTIMDVVWRRRFPLLVRGVQGVAGELRERLATFEAQLSELENVLKGLMDENSSAAMTVSETAPSDGAVEPDPVQLTDLRGLSSSLLARMASDVSRKLRDTSSLMSNFVKLLGRKMAGSDAGSGQQRSQDPSEGSGRGHQGIPATVTMLVPDDRIDRRVLLEARTLVRKGASVTVIAAPYPGTLDRDALEFPEITIVRIDTLNAPSARPDLSKSRLKAHDFNWREVYYYTDQFTLAALKHPAELFVAHDLPVLAAAIAAADACGGRLAYDAHELYPEQSHFGEERMELLRRVEAALIHLPDVVLTVNRSIAEEMHRIYGIQEPVVLLNAPDALHSVPRTTLLRDAFSLGENSLVFLYQGSLSLNRNLEALVESILFVKDPRVILVLMGPGVEKRIELEALAESHGLLKKKVYFHDSVPQDVLLSYTASADVGIIPYPGVDKNTLYCTPNKLFEFFVAQVPMLANDLPELRRFVQGEGVGINRAMSSPEQIAAAIDEIASMDRSPFASALRLAGPRMTWAGQEAVFLDACRKAMA